MPDEMIDVVDENSVVVDAVSRETADKLNHLVQNVLVFVFNSMGEVWIQRRAKTEKHFPGQWDISACGAVASGEKPDEAARRETLEEMGIKPKIVFVESFLNEFPGQDNRIYRRFSHLYVGVSDEIPKENDEVDEFKAVPHKQLARTVAKHQDQYIPSFLFELKKAVAAYKRL